MIVLGNGANNAPLSIKKKDIKGIYNFNFVENTAMKPAVNNVSLSQIVTFVGQKIQKAIEKPLTLIYMADTHKALDKMPKIKTATDKYSKESANPLIIHAGDYSMGSQGIEQQVEILNKIGVGIATLGNHEFFSGPKRLANSLNNSEFKTIVTNLEVPKANPLTSAFENNKLVHSLVKEIDGKKYGFIGAVTKSINGHGYNPYMDGIKANPPFEAICNEVKMLEQQGVNRIIMVSHLGYKYDKKMAQKVPGIDVIVGGHSHIALPGIKKDINLIDSNRKEPVLLLHAGAYGEVIGVSHLIFNDQGILQVKEQKLEILHNYFRKIFNLFKDKTVNTTRNNLVEVSSFKDDKEISQIVAREKNNMTQIATIKKPINGEWPVWGASELGSLTADAVKHETNSDVAIIQPGAIRLGIPKGKVYAEEIMNINLPFNTAIVKVKISGLNILKALNKGASSAGKQSKPGVLQVSGLKYTIDMSKHQTARVSEVLIKEGNEFKPLDRNKEYTVAFDKYLQAGGDNIDSLKNNTVIKEFSGKCYGSMLADYIMDNAENSDVIHKDFSDRIKIINRNDDDNTILSKFLHFVGIFKKYKVNNFVFKG